MFVWRVSSAGRAFASHARGRRFESCTLHPVGNDFIPGFFHALIFIYDIFTTLAKTDRQPAMRFCISHEITKAHLHWERVPPLNSYNLHLREDTAAVMCGIDMTFLIADGGQVDICILLSYHTLPCIYRLKLCRLSIHRHG